MYLTETKHLHKGTGILYFTFSTNESFLWCSLVKSIDQIKCTIKDTNYMFFLYVFHRIELVAEKKAEVLKCKMEQVTLDVAFPVFMVLGRKL